MTNYETLNLILLLFITLLEFVAFGWLIIQMRKSTNERDKILRLEERQIAMERRILKALDINQLVSTPDLIDFLDHISIEGDADVNLEEVDITKFPDSIREKTLGDMKMRFHTGCTVIGVKTSDGTYVINPGPNIILKENSKLFVLGNPDQIRSFNKILGMPKS
jgi:voltage-gated potassium channel